VYHKSLGNIKTYYTGFSYVSHELNDDTNTLTINLKLTNEECECPLCHKISKSKYVKECRTLADLPIDGHYTYFALNYHFYICRNKECDNKKKFKPLFSFYEYNEHRTNRLNDYILKRLEIESYRKAAISLNEEGIKADKTTLMRFKQRIVDGIHRNK